MQIAELLPPPHPTSNSSKKMGLIVCTTFIYGWEKESNPLGFLVTKNILNYLRR
jgi:hypothetical protein